MIMADYPDYCYIRSQDIPQGAIVPKSQVRISPEDRGFYFGDGVYEVMRTYGNRIFRLNDHLNRFRNSLQAVQIELSDWQRLGDICLNLVEANGLAGRDVFFYIQTTRGCYQRNLLFPPKEVMPTLYVSVNEIIPPINEREYGIQAITVEDIRWHRCDIKAIGLLASVLARNQAKAAGADEAIFVRNGILTEGTHTNLFLVKQGAVFTHPLDNHILPGVTRMVVLELCSKLNIPLVEMPIAEREISKQDEIFVTSTTWEIVPVVRVNGKPVGSGKPGVITRRLQTEFGNYVREILASP